MSLVPTCPAGFDCALQNSCPNLILDCPPGYFCSSYEGSPYQSTIDFRYAEARARYDNGVTITNENKLEYIDPDRTIQTSCMLGFYCPNSSTILPCPKGYWCSEATMKPHKCDVLSLCPQNSAYQINFVNAVIALILIVLVITTSCIMTFRQRRRNERSRLKEPTERSSFQDVSSDSCMEEVSSDTAKICFENLSYVVKSGERVILPSISGTIPGGKITVLLGPTAWLGK